MSRRARVSPEQAGVPLYGDLRRVPGLRRSEVAMLARVSVEYYIRLERGNLSGVSDAVLDAIASALLLNESERSHLFDLARAAGPPAGRPRRRSNPPPLRPSLQVILDGMTTIPALVRNGRMEILAINALGRALYAPAFADPMRPVNLARFCFVEPAARSLYADWNASADANVALLRTEAGRDPFDAGLSDLVSELSTRSKDFRVRWAAHEVRLHRNGTTRFRHPTVGDLDLTFDSLDLPDQPGLTLKAYSAPPGSDTEERLRLLASWSELLPGAGTPTGRPVPDARSATPG